MSTALGLHMRVNCERPAGLISPLPSLWHTNQASYVKPVASQSLPDAVTFAKTIHFPSTSERGDAGGGIGGRQMNTSRRAYSEWWPCATGGAGKGHTWDEVELSLIHSLARGRADNVRHLFSHHLSDAQGDALFYFIFFIWVNSMTSGCIYSLSTYVLENKI